MRSRVSTGDEWPGGSSVFQTTFLLGPNSVGNPVVAETPVPFGPRNCDQSSAGAQFFANVVGKANSKRSKPMSVDFSLGVCILINFDPSNDSCLCVICVICGSVPGCLRLTSQVFLKPFKVSLHC